MGEIELCGLTFTKLEDAKNHLRSRVENYKINAPIPDADIPLWFDVLQKHEWFDEYVTHGIGYFAATRSEQHPNLRNMVVVKDRGDPKPFSFQKYLSRGQLPKLAKVTAARDRPADHRLQNESICGWPDGLRRQREAVD